MNPQLQFDRGSSVKVKNPFARELSNIQEFEYMNICDRYFRF